MPSFSSTRIWDPAPEVWEEGPLMLNARTFPFGVVLSDDRVLVGGGRVFAGDLWFPMPGSRGGQRRGQGDAQRPACQLADTTR
jgi:hypothetical protein